MKKFIIILGILLISTSAFAVDWTMPDKDLTPGVVASTNIKKICVPGYSKTVRHTSTKTKNNVRRKYYDKYPDWPKCVKPRDCEIDHLVPLSLGGADVEANLWPEPNGKMGWLDKDKVEWRLHKLVCSGEMKIKTAQKIFKYNWKEGINK